MLRARTVTSLSLFAFLSACASTSEPQAAARAPESPRRTEAAIDAPPIAPVAAPSTDLAELKREAARAFQASEWASAAEMYREIVAAEPANAGAWFRRGYALHSLKDYRASATAFERSNEITPNATVAYDVACARTQLGELDLALDWLEKSVTLGMQDLPTLTTDTDIDPLRSSPRFQKVLQGVQNVVQPCANRAESRQFDFWIGEWDVTDTAGNKVGDSRIERILDGCVLLENWSGARGGSGKSLNLYDTATSSWKQTWCDSRGGLVEFRDGKISDGALVFHADTPAPNGTGRVARRLSFFDLGADGVRQFSEQSRDGGSTWTTEYDFRYRRKPARG